MASDGGERAAGEYAADERLDGALSTGGSDAESGETVRDGGRAAVQAADNAVARGVEDNFTMLELLAAAEFDLLGEGDERGGVNSRTAGDHQFAATDRDG